jgi:hypothetical protein
MDKPISERFITFSPKSARLPYPDDLELGQDITVTIGTRPFIYNVVKVEFFDNQDGQMNVNYILKSTLE